MASKKEKAKKVSSKIKKIMGEYKKTGKTVKGHRPKSKKAAQKQAVAVALSESDQSITKFITAIIAKNYAEANKYLTGIVQDKLQKRISANLEQPLF